MAASAAASSGAMPRVRTSSASPAPCRVWRCWSPPAVACVVPAASMIFHPRVASGHGRRKSAVAAWETASTAAGESVVDPGASYGNIVAGSLSLLEAILDHRLGGLVFSSTAAVYGTPLKDPIPESHPLEPINPYGASKLMIERMIADFGAAHGLRFARLRYFNAAGADPQGELGEAHEPETHAIPLALLTALGRRQHFDVFGGDYPTPDGSAIRDYIHVADLAAAHVLALQRLLAGGDS